MANGNVIPNLGESSTNGLGTVNAHPTKFGTQVADVTKPLAAATEAVDGGRTIILHRTGGIVKKPSHESEIVMVDGTLFDDSFEQDRAWDDSGIPTKIL